MFRTHDHVVYRPGFLATAISEEGQGLPDHQKKVVHGVVWDQQMGEVYIKAENQEDSGWFSADKVERDHSNDPLF